MKIEDNGKQQTQTMAPLLLFAINDTKTIIWPEIYSRGIIKKISFSV